MKNSLRRIMAMALAILMVLTSGPLTAVAEIVSGNQTDVSQGFSLFSLKPYTKTLHATFVSEGTTVAEQYVLAGGTLSVPATPEKKDHKFTGWTPSISGAPAPGATVSADFLAGVDEDPVNVTYTAEFTPVYYVFFHDTALTLAEAGARVIYTLEGVNNDVITFEGVPTPVLTGNYAFVNWLHNGTAVESVTINGSNIDLYPDVQEGHWINYHSGDGGTYIEPVFVAPTAVTVAPSQPTRAGYKFEHWSLTEGGEAFTFGNKLETAIDLYAVWTPQTVNYTVIHFLENVDDDKFSFQESETKTGTTGALTAAAAKSYDGFTAQEITQQTIAGDGSTIVEVKYARNVYTIYFYNTGSNSAGWSCGKEEHDHEASGCEYKSSIIFGGYWDCFKEEHSHAESGCTYSDGSSDAIASITAKHGANISSQWPSRSNGSTNWSTVSGGGAPYQGGIDVMPIGGGTFYVPSSESSSRATASYYVEVLDGESGTTVNGHVYKLHHSDTVMLNDPSITWKEDFYNLTGFTRNETDSSQDGKDYDGAKFYYYRNDYTIQFINGGSVVHTVTKQYEADISGVSYDPSRPTSVPAGYKFMGWFDNEAGTGSEYTFTGKMPAKNITVYAKWVAPVYDATVYLTINGQGGSEVKKVPYGTAISPDEMPAVNVPEGYEMYGWSTEPNAYVPFNFDTKIYGNISLYPYYAKTGAFTVTYKVSAGTAPVDDATYADGSHAEVMAPGTTSYDDNGTTMVFVYWQGADGIYYPKDKIAIHDNVSLTAVYKAVEAQGCLIYHANNGTGATDSYTLYINQPHTVQANSFEKAGYTFAGWATSANGEAEYAAGAKISLDSATEHNLYAVWEPIEQHYTVEFYYENTDGTYSIDSSLTATRTAKTDENVSVTDADKAQTKGTNYKHNSSMGVLSGTIPATGALVLKVYFDLNTADYTVHHYLKGTTTMVADDYNGTATIGDTVKANTPGSVSYGAVAINPDASIEMKASGNEITVYYTIPVTVTADDKTKNFGEDNPALTAKVEGLIEGDTIQYSLSTAATKTSTVGAYTITTTAAAEQGYYTVTPVNGTLNILSTPVVVTIVGNTKTVTYNGEEQQVTGYKVTSITSNGKAYSGYGESYIVFSGNATAKGTNASADKYMMGLTASQFKSNDTANYNVTFEVTDGWLKIDPVADEVIVTIVGNKDEVTFDGAAHTVKGYTATSNNALYGAVAGTDYTFSGTDSVTGTNAGNYPMGLAEGQFSNKNSNFTNVKFQVTDGQLVINRAKVTVDANDNGKTYGEKDPTLTANVTGLVGNDTVAYTVTRKAGENVGTYPITAAGEAKQGNYEVTYVGGTFTISKAGTLIVNAGNKNQVYNGQALVGPATPNVTEGTTVYYSVDGGEWTTTVPSITDVGTVTVEAYATNPNYENSEKTTYTLTVIKAPLTITTEGGQQVYNGQALTNANGKIDGLQNNETATITPTGSQTNVGDSQNGYTIAWGTAKESNYEIKTENLGTLKVTPATVTVTVQNAIKTYGDDDPTFEAKVSGLVAGESESLIVYTITRARPEGTNNGENVGGYALNAVGEKTQGNYTVEYVPATLTIVKREVTVTITENSDEVIYNGLEQKVEGYTYDISDSLYTVNDFTFKGTAIAKGTDQGSYPMNVTVADFVNNNNNFDVTFEVKDGQLVIMPVADKVTVTVTGNTKTETYNGTTFTVEGYMAKSDNELYHTVLDTDYTFTGKAKASGMLANTEANPKYPMNLTSAQFKNINKNFTNVEFVIEDGWLKINPTETKITITAGTLDKTYDGTPLTDARYTVSGTLVEGDKIVDVVVTGSQTVASSSANKVTSFKVVNAAGQDVTASYSKIGVVDGSLLVRVRPVTITAANLTYTYDGTAKPVEDAVKYSIEGLAANQNESDVTVLYADAATQTVVGTYTAVASGAKIKDASGNDVTANYEITYKPGELVINPIGDAITITADSATKTYDGQPLTKSTYTVDGAELIVDGDTLVVVVEGTITDVGAVANKVTSYKVLRGNVDVTPNYTFNTPVDGTLTVTERTVTLTSETASKEYDGTALVRPDVTVGGHGFVEGEVTDVKATGTITEEGFVTNTITYTGTGAFKAANYTVTKDEGTLTINKSTVEIVVTPGNATKTYDGTVLTQPDATVTGVPEGFTYKVTTAGEIKDVDTADNTVYSFVIYNKDGKDVTNQFANITKNKGTLTVTPKAVTVTADNKSKVYLDTDPDWTAQVEGLVEGESLDLIKYDLTRVEGENVGTYTITPSGDKFQGNYQVTYIPGTLTITANATLTVAGVTAEKVYDAEPLSTTATASVVNGTTIEYSLDGENWSTEAPSITDVGSITVQVRATNPNYTTATNSYTLTVTKRDVNVTANSDTFTYNGEAKQALGADGKLYIISGLVEGHEESGVVVKYNGEDSQTNVGTYVAGADVTAIVITDDGEDVTKNYNVTSANGTLVIEKLAVTVTITGNTDSKVYNREEQQVEGYKVEISDKLYTESDFTFSGTKVAKGTDVDEYPMSLAKDQFTNNNANFVVNFVVNDGKLTITPVTDKVTVTITEHSGTATYDGKEHEVTGYDVSISNSLYKEADFTFSGDATIKGTDVDTYPMGLTSQEFKNINDNFTDVEFKIVDGQLEITPLAVTVTITGNSDIKVYNGSEQQVVGYKVEISDKLYTESDFTFSGTKVAKGTDVDEYPMSLAKDQFTNNNANFVVNFVVNDGKLTITPVTDKVTVTITEHSDTVTYDGKEHEVTGYDVTSISNSLYKEADFTFSGADSVKGTNAGTYDMELKPEDFTNTSKNFSNVEFVIVDGTLVIGKRPVTLTSESAEKVYDETALTKPEVTVGGEGFVEGEVSDIKATGTIIEVGTITNSITFTKGDNFKADNYDITYNEGTLKVTALDTVVVTITEKSGSYVYNGQEQQVTGYTVEINNSLYKESDFTFLGDEAEKDKVVGINVGTYKMELTDKDFENKNPNFTKVTFVIVDGEMEITKRPITIKANDNLGIPYDGLAHGKNGFTVTNAGVKDQGLADGHSVSDLTISGSRILVDYYEKELVPSAATIVDDKTADVTSNYNITYVEGDLEIVSVSPVIPEKTTPEVTSDYQLGDKIPFNITVLNITNEELTNVTVTDPTATIVAGEGYTVTSEHVATIPSIPAGETVVVKAEHTVTSDDILAGTYKNTATVKVNDKEVTASSGTDEIADVVATLDVSKETTSTPKGINGYALNEVIDYEIVVTNTGNVPLYNVQVTDPLTGMTQSIDTLAVGASETYTTRYTVTEADILAGSITNVVNAEAEDVIGPDDKVHEPKDSATVTDDAEDLNVALDVTKTVDKAHVSLGDVITYTIVVKHQGNVTYPNVVVTDALANLIITEATSDKQNEWTIDNENGTVSAAKMLVGEVLTITATYTVTSDDILRGFILNSVNAKGDEIKDPKQPETPKTPEGGDDVESDTDPVNTTMTVTKTSKLPDGHDTAALGDVITYTITAKNNGNVPFNNVAITDELEGLTITNVESTKEGFTYTQEGNTIKVETLAVGETITITATYKVVEDDVMNGKVTNHVVANATAIVTPTPTPGPEGGDPTPAPTPLPTPGATNGVEDKTDPVDTDLELVKEVVNASEQYALNETVEYKITVTNAGNVPFYNVVVNDPLTGLNETIEELGVGKSEEFTTQYTVISEDILRGFVYNVATAKADPIVLNPAEPDNKVTPMARDDAEIKTVPVDVSMAVNKESKLPEGHETAALGDVITYTITVENTGNVPYTNVTVKDPLAGLVIDTSDAYTVNGDTVTIAVLPVGETVTITATYVVTEADILAGVIKNDVTVGSDPVVTPTPTPGPEGGDPTPTPTSLPTPGATDFVTNEPDDLNVALVVTKTSNTEGKEAELGQEITYTITVEHKGNVAYPNIVVSDELEGLTITEASSNMQNTWTIDNENGTVSADQMLVGEVLTITASYTVTSDDILVGSVTNVATAAGDPIEDPKELDKPKIPSDSDDVEDETVPVDTTLTVEKTSKLPDNKEKAALGDVIEYTITVTNDGNVPFYNIKVVDEWTEDEWTIETLGVGESKDFTATHTVTSDDILAGKVVNAVTATGDPIDNPKDPENPKTPEDGDEVEDETDDVDATLTVVKTSDVAENETVSLGAVITYTITVTNNGNVPFYEVEVIDEMTGFKTIIDVLAVGETQEFKTTHTVTTENIEDGFVFNEVTAKGKDIPDPKDPENPKKPEGGDDVEDETDDVNVTLTVEKTSDANGEDVELGQEITYTITVKNDGNVPYYNVVVTDEWVEEEWTIETLAVGETKTYNAYYTVQESDILTGFVTNYVSAEADPVFDPKNEVELTPADDAEVTDETDDIDATIEVIKVSDVEEGVKVAPGDVINYTITITNKGNVTFSGVAVVDELPGIVINDGEGYTVDENSLIHIETLEQKASVVVTAYYEVQPEDILKGYVVNTVVATGDPVPDPKDPENPVIPEGKGDESDEVIDIDPTLSVTKATTSTPSGTNGYDLGQEITYAMTVTNDGNIVMHNLVVSDPLTGDTWMIEKLDLGETVSFTATYPGVTSNDILAGKVTNTVYAVAESIPDPKNEGEVITPSGSASVTDIPEDIDVGMKVVKKSQGMPEDGYYRVGETIKYQIKVTNEGNVPYERLEVFDELTGDFWTVYDLQVGETREFYCQYTVKQKDLIRGYVLNRAVVTGDPIPDPKNPDEPKIPKGEGIEIDYTNPTPMGTGIINLNVGDCCE